jgi:arsenate reductase-like glutaredoxin family protein
LLKTYINKRNKFNILINHGFSDDKKGVVMTTNLVKKVLKVGMAIPTYREMCGILGEEEKSTKGKKYQLLQWQRYFMFHKKGKFNFVIDEIFDEEKPIPPRKDNIYLGLLEIVLMNKLSLEVDCSVNMTKRNLYEYVGFVNTNYSNKDKNAKTLNDFMSNHKEDKLIKTQKQALFYYNDFSDFINHKIDRLLFDALNSMQKRHLIFYNKEYVIEEPIRANKEIIDYRKRTATKEEISEILQMTSDFKSIHPEFKFVNPYNCDDYYNGLNGYIESLTGWSKTFLTISIVINKKYIRSYIPEVKSNIEAVCKESKLNLNLVAIDKFNEYFETRYNNNLIQGCKQIKEKLNFAPSDWTEDDYIEEYKKNGITKDGKDNVFIYEKEYLQLQRELIQLYIALDNETNRKDDI